MDIIFGSTGDRWRTIQISSIVYTHLERHESHGNQFLEADNDQIVECRWIQRELVGHQARSDMTRHSKHMLTWKELDRTFMRIYQSRQSGRH